MKKQITYDGIQISVETSFPTEFEIIMEINAFYEELGKDCNYDIEMFEIILNKFTSFSTHRLAVDRKNYKKIKKVILCAYKNAVRASELMQEQQ